MAADPYRQTMEAQQKTEPTKEIVMILHPALMLAYSRERQNELIAEADRQRLLTAARRHRRFGGTAEASATARGRPDGTLAACGPRVAAPAR